MSKLKIILLITIVLLSACQTPAGETPTAEIVAESETDAPTQPGDTPPPADTPTPPLPTPMPTREFSEPLVICMGEEPNTLYPYGDLNASARQVLQAIYDGPIDIVNYQPQPVILQEIPNFENGLAQIHQVTVQERTLVLNANGIPTALTVGMEVFPTGCRSADCAVKFDGVPLVMDQLKVQFRLLPELYWSNGEPLTSADSVYGFALASSPDTPGSKYAEQRTQHYISIDGTTVEWLGLPGFMDQNYSSNFWAPAPLHAWGDASPADLLAAAYAAETPLGWGPYRVADWTAGEQIVLEFNPYYFRAAEGLPYFPELIFKIIGTDSAANLQALADGSCDILDTSAILEADQEVYYSAASEGDIGQQTYSTSAWEHLAFNIMPFSHDDGFSLPAADAPDLFSDLRFRQALAHCIDTEALASQFTFSTEAALTSMIPSAHPLLPDDLMTYDYDPELANQLLDEIGWTQRADGVRTAQGIPGVYDYSLLTLTYHTANDPNSAALAEVLADQLNQCGINLQIITLPQTGLLAAGPEGPLFGRTFQMAEFAWTSGLTPPCQLFVSDAIPGSDPELRPLFWTGWNMTGWENEAYDQACSAARQALPGEPAFTANYQKALRILAEDLSILPLFNRWESVFTRPDFCGWDSSSTTSVFWNLEAFGYGELCK